MAPYRAVSGGVVADVLSGLRCSHVRPFRRKAATDATVLAQVLAGPSGQDLRAVCDLAVLCFGRAFCLRRSKLVVLRAEDLDRVSEGLRVTVRCCKTDQKGRRTMVVVPQGRSLRPMVALETSPRAAGITERPVFQLWRRSCAIRTPDLLPTSRVIGNRSCRPGLPGVVRLGSSGYPSGARLCLESVLDDRRKYPGPPDGCPGSLHTHPARPSVDGTMSLRPRAGEEGWFPVNQDAACSTPALMRNGRATAP